MSERIVILQPRDLAILRGLALGPLTLGQLMSNLRHVKKIERVERKRGAPVKTQDPLKEAVRVRIGKLAAAGYIETKRYNPGRGGLALYALTEDGARALYADGMDYDQIRKGLPHRYGISHEMEVVSVLRGLERESREIRYALKWRDEKSLRAANRGIGRGVAYPDIRAQISIDMKSQGTKNVTLNFEIDNNTIPPAIVYEKIAKHNAATLLLCTVQKRINELKAYIQSQENPNPKLHDKRFDHVFKIALFCLQADFIENGLLAADITNSAGQRAIIIPPQYAQRTGPR